MDGGDTVAMDDGPTPVEIERTNSTRMALASSSASSAKSAPRHRASRMSIARLSSNYRFATSKSYLYGDDDRPSMKSSVVVDPTAEDSSGTLEGNSRQAAENEAIHFISLQEDVYSLLFVEGCSIAMLFSILVVTIQVVVIVLMSYDLIRSLDEDDISSNPLKVPINVEPQVRAAQFLSLPLAVMSHADCTTAVYLLHVKYEKDRVDKYAPAATRSSWYISLVMRFMTGFCLVAVSFVVIVQSDRIVDLFLDLGAIAFVGELDNWSFWLAKTGFLKSELQEAAYKVSKITFRPHIGNGRTIKRRILLLFTWVILTAAWLIIVVQQEQGHYLEAQACKTFSARFGSDEFPVVPSKIDFSNTLRSYTKNRFINETTGEPIDAHIRVPFSSFTGTYRIGSEVLDGRAVYYEDISVDRNSQDDKSAGKFRYCSGKGGRDGNWIFVIETLIGATHPTGTDEVCKNWLLRSGRTSSYLLEDVIDQPWQAWTGQVVKAEGFVLQCDDCNDAFDCNLHGTCNKDTGICECDDGVLGNTCSILPPCLTMASYTLGTDSRAFKDFGTYHLMYRNAFSQTKSERKEPLLVYGRPVYFQAFSAPNVTVDSSSVLSEVYAMHFDSNNLTIDDGLTFTYNTRAKRGKNGIFDNCIGVQDLELLVVYYAGDRWFEWDTYASCLYFEFFHKQTPPHRFWDRMYNRHIHIFTDPTTSGTPQGLQWNWRSKSQAIGNFDRFGAHSKVEISFQCTDTSCDGLCGEYGVCNATTNQCECNTCFGGHYCEYEPIGAYAKDDFQTALTAYQNGTELAEKSKFNQLYWSGMNLTSCKEEFG